MASYKIIIFAKVYKDLKKIPKDIVRDIFLETENLADNPRPRNCKKLKGMDGNEYRLKVRKDYRVLYQVFDKEKTVHVLRVLDRKDAYR